MPSYREELKRSISLQMIDISELKTLHESRGYQSSLPDYRELHGGPVSSSSKGSVVREAGYLDEVFSEVELKVDKLSELYLEQCRLLSQIKGEIIQSKLETDQGGIAQNNLLIELLKKILEHCKLNELEDLEAPETSVNHRAKSLLDAIQVKGFSLDREIGDAVLNLLQSDDLHEHIVSAAVSSSRDLIQTTFSRDLATLYLPLLEQSHQRLVQHVSKVMEAAFVDLERHKSTFSKSAFRSSLALRRALMRHQHLLETSTSAHRPDTLKNIAQEVLQSALHQCRPLALQALCPPPPPLPDFVPRAEWLPTSPLEHAPSLPQPSHPGTSIIDQLMKSAEIKKQIEDGDVSGAFEKALLAADLSLVVAACRAVDPVSLFGKRQLTPPVLLSLAQQLATDMVHETILKCRFLEETLINLSASEAGIRAHLPMVVGEIQKHLNDFLAKYPSHVARRRVMLIIMAANNLLK